MLPLHVKRYELTYEAALMPILGAMIDTPGRMVSALLSRYEQDGLDLSDISLVDAPLSDRSVTCEMDNVTVELRPDRFEIRYFTMDEHDDHATDILRGVWHAIITVSPDVRANPIRCCLN